MIRVNGVARLRVDYSVDLNMTIDEWESMSTRKVNELLDSSIDWYDVVRGAETEDMDIEDVEEIDEEE